MKLLKLLIVTVILNISACATVPERITDSSKIETEFQSVGYRASYWGIGFEHIANLSINKKNLQLHDEDVNMVILYKNINSINYEKPFFTDSNNYIIINYKIDNEVKTAYFTSFENLGWTPGTAEIYQSLIFHYEKNKI